MLQAFQNESFLGYRNEGREMAIDGYGEKQLADWERDLVEVEIYQREHEEIIEE